ncbi:hypothetical protein JW949_02260 [Candidatus Woesearchaeota archaeon]|nr:hypothetical protein [Candidatus Woesearchaeota archaeon]
MRLRIIQNIMILSIFFVLGMLINQVYADVNIEQMPDQGNNYSIMERIYSGPVERASPSDTIKPEQILVYNDRVVIDIQDAFWAVFTDTNSMDPVIDVEANAIEIKPKFPEDVITGDIVAYTSNYGEGVFIHRVIEKGEDSNGYYFIVKGDNVERSTEKIRFDDIVGKVVAIIY